MTYTAENPHADGSTVPGARPRYPPPRHIDLPDTSRTHDNWKAARQMSCRQQTAPPQPRCSKDITAHTYRFCFCKNNKRTIIIIGPEPVLTAHARSQLQRAATVWQELIQPRIRNRILCWTACARGTSCQVLIRVCHTRLAQGPH
jgi:hypothetical protein